MTLFPYTTLFRSVVLWPDLSRAVSWPKCQGVVTSHDMRVTAQNSNTCRAIPCRNCTVSWQNRLRRAIFPTLGKTLTVEHPMETNDWILVFSFKPLTTKQGLTNGFYNTGNGRKGNGLHLPLVHFFLEKLKPEVKPLVFFSPPRLRTFQIFQSKLPNFKDAPK